MARAMQASKSRAGSTGASKSRAGSTGASKSRAGSTGTTKSGVRSKARVAPAKPARKVVPRTPAERKKANSSPLARAVTRKNAPKATRVFIYTVASLAAVIITLMMVVVIFQTRLAATQLNIDVIEDQIAIEQARYNELRLERSTLREPSRLVEQATALGMVPGTKTTFTNIDPNAVAEVLVSMGGLDLEQFANTREPLKNYSAVKAIFGGGS